MRVIRASVKNLNGTLCGAARLMSKVELSDRCNGPLAICREADFTSFKSSENAADHQHCWPQALQTTPRFDVG